MMIKCLYIKVADAEKAQKNHELLSVINYKVVELERDPGYANHLKQMRDLIDCNCIGHTCVTVPSGKQYDIWLDDEGKLYEPCKIPSLTLFYQGELYDWVVGNIIITTSNEMGDTTGLTDEEVDEFLNYYNTSVLGILSKCVHTKITLKELGEADAAFINR